MKTKRLVFIPIISSLLVIFAVLFYIIKSNRSASIKHIFLITIDTLRADHLGTYGYPRNTSPFIDSLAEKGVLFENAFSQSSTTCPSHASIFTGLYRSQHGLLANHYILPESTTTLAEILKEKGFKTAAFTSTEVHFLSTNLNQGFEFYEEPIDTRETYRIRYRPARLTINNAIIWLDNFNPSKKLFFWVHVYDPHLPYSPPREHIKNLDQNKKDLLKFLEKYNINPGIFNTEDDLYRYITQYDAEIRYVDEELKRLYGFVENKGLNKNSLWIITSDHGEGLGQHNYLNHSKMLYQEQLHVPLIFFFTDSKIKAQRLKNVVENFNIFSTVLDILKIDIENKLKKEIQSVSLWPIIKGSNQNKIKQFAFSEREKYPAKDPFPKNIPEHQRIWEKGDKYSIQDENYKYILRTHYQDEFYNLKTDPHEKTNLIDENSNHIRTFKGMILRNLKFFERYADKKERKVDPKVRKKLKSLGYIN